MASFDARSSSFSAQSGPYPAQVSTSFRSSFGESGRNAPQQMNIEPQIYTAVYSGVAVYEMEIQGVAVMRRRADSWLNATQILKVAGVDKGKRTKILEKEILTGHHEKIQGGYGRYQGTWINYHRGRDFCRAYGVEDTLRALLDYDLISDGTGVASKTETPTKEQAMAANRKRFYNSTSENTRSHPLSTGTFFQNISPTASNALAAMNKAARFDQTMSRPNSAQRKPGLIRQPSQLSQSQDYAPTASQQSTQSFSNDAEMSTQINGHSQSESQLTEEPPRKRLRPSSSQDNHNFDPALRGATPTEPNDSFMYAHAQMDFDQGPVTSVPMFAPSDKAGEERRLALLDLFADISRTDYSSHPALLHISGRDLDSPLDSSANTALHWAATLARVPLMRLLIAKGADMFQGNAAGQTPLMAAVQVNNCLDHGCFPEMLEILGPLIDIRDSSGRTVLHHIAVSSGIKGRAQCSRYYLESVLEYTVRQGTKDHATQQASFNSFPQQSKSKPMSLGRFMAEVVNVQDKGGNTALNLVARIGNRPIINQLAEVGADFDIPNHTNFRPTDFGIFPKSQTSQQPSSTQASYSSQEKPPSQLEQIKEEIFATTSSILTQTQSQYAIELQKKQDVIDHHNAELRSISSKHKEEQEKFNRLQRSTKNRNDRQQKIENLKRANTEQKIRLRGCGLLNSENKPIKDALKNIDPTLLGPVDIESIDDLTPEQRSYLQSLPSSHTLSAQLESYESCNQGLSDRISALKGRSLEVEEQYRKVVSLCTGVEESKVESVLEGLVAAVESEENQSIEVGRVRDFLRKVEGVGN